jgi:hypothetical protein
MARAPAERSEAVREGAIFVLRSMILVTVQICPRGVMSGKGQSERIATRKDACWMGACGFASPVEREALRPDGGHLDWAWLPQHGVHHEQCVHGSEMCARRVECAALRHDPRSLDRTWTPTTGVMTNCASTDPRCEGSPQPATLQAPCHSRLQSSPTCKHKTA